MQIHRYVPIYVHTAFVSKSVRAHACVYLLMVVHKYSSACMILQVVSMLSLVCSISGRDMNCRRKGWWSFQEESNIRSIPCGDGSNSVLRYWVLDSRQNRLWVRSTCLHAAVLGSLSDMILQSKQCKPECSGVHNSPYHSNQQIHLRTS